MSERSRGRADRIARKLVQIGFLLVFLWPLAPEVYRRLTSKPAPTLTSWLLPWDPLLLVGEVVQRHWAWLVFGAPLTLLALTFVLGRFFCGWVCPMGTLLDLVRPLAFWRRWTGKRPPRQGLFPADRSSPLRYYLLIVALLGAALSVQALGALDPLVIFHRATTALATDAIALRQSALRVSLSVVSLVFVAILVLELVQARFWCRHLCPLGALLGLVSRFSLLNRRVGKACNACGDCRRACPMNAIGKDPHDTDYADCTMCLSCEGACPRLDAGSGSRAWPRVRRVWPSSRSAGSPGGALSSVPPGRSPSPTSSAPASSAASACASARPA